MSASHMLPHLILSKSKHSVHGALLLMKEQYTYTNHVHATTMLAKRK